jgi:muramoyltetrapeptide carboxypeptidase
MRIAVVAPSSRFTNWQTVRQKVDEIAAEAHPGTEIVFHPQCGLREGHFAGSDAERAAALVQVANDPAFDAVWFGRGGYGSNRIAADALSRFGHHARAKKWLGYSDAGFLLAGLYRKGYERVAHGPMPWDATGYGDGKEAVLRALGWLVDASVPALEPELDPGARHAAFNITVLSTLLGTELEPDFAGHVLLLEEVSEAMYAIDRAMFHITSSANVRQAAAIRPGRFNKVTANSPAFGKEGAEVVAEWCEKAGIPLGRPADIGHDSANKVVPFGLL